MSNGNGGWMPLYIGDYLSDTMELDAAQHGAYLLLLMYYWRNGPLPLEDTKLAQIARTELRVWKKTVGPIIRAFFHERDGRLHQKRADAELAKATEYQQRAQAVRETDADRLRRWRQQRQMPTREWDELRAEIFARDGGKCQRCGSGDDLHCDHIRELSDGGTNDPGNLITLCRTCHSRKTAEAKTARPSLPHKPNGEMAPKRISKAFPDHIFEHIETPFEMLPPQTPPSLQSQVQHKEESKRSIYNYSLSSPESRAREAPSGSQSLTYDELHDVPTLTEIRKNREAFARDNAAAVTTGAGVRRVASSLSISRPAEAKRSKWEQIAAVTEPAKPTTASSYPVAARTPEQQLAELLGIPLEQAAASFQHQAAA